jgi:spermidine/putrescine-binding protein
MVEEGFLAKLDLSRIPNLANINPTFKDLWWDPTNEYQVPKDYGTTGILYRKSLVSKIPSSWREFYEMIKGEASGKTVFVDSMGDVFVFPLKMLGYSLNTVEKAELDEARTILLDVAPHLYALDSNQYGFKMKDGTSVLTLGWTGPLGQELADEKAAGEAGYVVPSEGTLFWLDTWVMLADAPHPNASYAWLNFIHEPEVQGEETNYNLYATPNDLAKEFVKPEILSDAAIFPPDDVIASLEGAEDTSGNNQRIDIWEEFKQAIGG